MRDHEEVVETARSMRATLAKLNRRLRAVDEAAGVGSTGFSLLGRLLRDGPSTAAALATAEHLQPQSLTRALRALESAKLITRVVDDDDRRKSIITISRPGIDVLQKSARNRESWLARALLSTLSPTERDMLRIAAKLIERVADAAE